jgi:hypothetical protein
MSTFYLNNEHTMEWSKNDQSYFGANLIPQTKCISFISQSKIKFLQGFWELA